MTMIIITMKLYYTAYKLYQVVKPYLLASTSKDEHIKAPIILMLGTLIEIWELLLFFY